MCSHDHCSLLIGTVAGLVFGAERALLMHEAERRKEEVSGNPAFKVSAIIIPHVVCVEQHTARGKAGAYPTRASWNRDRNSQVESGQGKGSHVSLLSKAAITKVPGVISDLDLGEVLN